MTERFEYNYSAKQQEEVEAIRKKYAPCEEDKMALLRKMDRDVEKPGTIAAIIAGVIGTLLLGIGMCCTMIWMEMLFIPGILIGILGIILIAAAYPIFKQVTKKQREKMAPQILALTEELMK